MTRIFRKGANACSFLVSREAWAERGQGRAEQLWLISAPIWLISWHRSLSLPPSIKARLSSCEGTNQLSACQLLRPNSSDQEQETPPQLIRAGVSYISWHTFLRDTLLKGCWIDIVCWLSLMWVNEARRQTACTQTQLVVTDWAAQETWTDGAT